MPDAHHTVPRAYLVGFADKDGLVVVDRRRPWEKQLRAQIRTPIKRISTRPDQYALRRSTGLDDGPERALGGGDPDRARLVQQDVTYPLNRRYCLVMAYKRIVSEAHADDSIVETINARTAGFSKSEVYVAPCDARGQDAVQRAFVSKSAIFESLAARSAMPNDIEVAAPTPMNGG